MDESSFSSLMSQVEQLNNIKESKETVSIVVFPKLDGMYAEKNLPWSEIEVYQYKTHLNGLHFDDYNQMINSLKIFYNYAHENDKVLTFEVELTKVINIQFNELDSNGLYIMKKDFGL